VALVELIDTNRKNTMTGMGWQPIDRTLIGETHHYILIDEICTHKPALVPIIATTFDTIVLAAVATISPRRNPSCGSYEGAVKSRSQAPCISAETPSRVGRELTRCLEADMRKV
jgi:hypothetical protein